MDVERFILRVRKAVMARQPAIPTSLRDLEEGDEDDDEVNEVAASL